MNSKFVFESHRNTEFDFNILKTCNSIELLYLDRIIY